MCNLGDPAPRHIEILDEQVVEVLRRKTPAERVAIGLACDRFVRQRLEAHLHDMHPEWGDAQVAAEIAWRMHRGTG